MASPGGWGNRAPSRRLIHSAALWGAATMATTRPSRCPAKLMSNALAGSWKSCAAGSARASARNSSSIISSGCCATTEHDPDKWERAFGKRSCSNKEVERGDDSRKNHPALRLSTPRYPHCGALLHPWHIVAFEKTHDHIV